MGEVERGISDWNFGGEEDSCGEVYEILKQKQNPRRYKSPRLLVSEAIVTSQTEILAR
jgi:hypothetical protein